MRDRLTRSSLGEHRPDYTFICGICGKTIQGKSNTIHLAIKSHLKAEFKLGKRVAPFTSSKYGDKCRKFI